MTGLWLLVLLPLLSVTGEENAIPRDLGYDSYDSQGYPDSRWQFSGGPTPTAAECSSPWRPLLAGLLLGALVKLPLLILGKLLLLKVAVPLAVAGALVPLGVFTIYRAAMSQQAAGNSTARTFPQSCLQAAACGIGRVAPKTAVPSTSWVLKMLGQAMEKEWAMEGEVAAYREAYIKGAASKSCPQYPCPFF